MQLGQSVTETARDRKIFHKTKLNSFEWCMTCCCMCSLWKKWKCLGNFKVISVSLTKWDYTFFYIPIKVSFYSLLKRKRRKKIIGLKGQKLTSLWNILSLYDLSYEIQGKKHHSAFVLFMQWFLQNQS